MARIRHLLILLVAVSVVFVLSFVLSTGSPSVAAVPTNKAPFVAQNCREAMAFFLVQESKVRPFVPKRFAVNTAQAGLAELLIMITACDEMSGGGRSLGDVLFSEVGVYIEDPEEKRDDPAAAPGFQYYQLWHLTNDRALRKVIDRLGVTGGWVKDASYDALTPFDAEAAMPWSRVLYEISVVAPSRAGIFQSRPSTWWHLSDRGLARTSYVIESGLHSYGLTRLVTEEGSPLAEMVGGDSAFATQGVIGIYPEMTITPALLRN